MGSTADSSGRRRHFPREPTRRKVTHFLLKYPNYTTRSFAGCGLGKFVSWLIHLALEQQPMRFGSQLTRSCRCSGNGTRFKMWKCACENWQKTMPILLAATSVRSRNYIYQIRARHLATSSCCNGDCTFIALSPLTSTETFPEGRSL